MWQSILVVIIQLIGYFLEKNKINTELMREFYAWAEKIGNDLGSSKLRAYVQQQLDWLNKNPWKPS